MARNLLTRVFVTAPPHFGAFSYPLPRINTKDSNAVVAAVDEAFRRMDSAGDPPFAPMAFGWVEPFFRGESREYGPIDALYHDLEHTLQGALAFADLLLGRVEAGAAPRLSCEIAQLGLLAMFLHDTGYLKRRDDAQGTGAKYTQTHVRRSCEFAAALLKARRYTESQIRAVNNMIRCTGVGARVDAIAFQSDQERIAGCALGAADLLGQMAAPDYIEKLPILYEEFRESAEFNRQGAGGGPEAFSSADDLIRKTPIFWRHYVIPRVEKDFLGLHRFLARPAPDGPNGYLDAIEANIGRLEARLAKSAQAGGR